MKKKTENLDIFLYILQPIKLTQNPQILPRLSQTINTTIYTETMLPVRTPHPIKTNHTMNNKMDSQQ